MKLLNKNLQTRNDVQNALAKMKRMERLRKLTETIRKNKAQA